MTNKWKPMRTAPKDGTPVLLLVDGTAVQGRRGYGGYWIIDVLEPYDVDTEDWYAEPTGWCPLPAKLTPVREGPTTMSDNPGFLYAVAIRDPENAPLPSLLGSAARLIDVAADAVDENTMTTFITYLKRMEPHWQVLFLLRVGGNGYGKRWPIACRNKAFIDLTLAHRDNI